MANRYWQRPSQCSNKLYLPTFPDNFDIHQDRPFQHEDIYIPVDKTFIRVFESGTSNLDLLLNELTILVSTFNTLVKTYQQHVAVYEKDAHFDLVTEMDKGIEFFLRYWIHTHFPTHKIIGEEFGQDIISPHDFCWYIDPIDGTANYAQGKHEYCLNIGCVYQGAPFLHIVGLPTHDRILAADATTPIQHSNSPKPRVCSEFYAVRELETQFFKEIQHMLKRESYRTMALGYSLAHMSMGYCDVFYKANVKLWDVIAPLGILALTQSEYWDIELMTYDGHYFSPFSNERAFIDYLNKRHQDNCRVGLLTITPKSNPEFISIIREIVHGSSS